MIECDARTRTALVQLRRELWRTTEPARLDAGIVETAIRDLGPLPDELLAYCAAIGSLAMLLSDNEELDAFYRGNDEPDWRSRANLDDAVAFDAWGEWPRSYAMYAPSGRTFGIFALKTGTLEPVASIADLVARRLTNTSPPSAEELAAFAPAIARAEVAVRRVVHAKFGTGTVLREAEGKLEIDFAEHGVKLLAARFVRHV